MGQHDPYRPILDAHLHAWAEREARAVRAGERRLPEDTVREVRSSRILAGPIPSSLDGPHGSLAQAVSAVARIARVAPSTALCLAMPLANAANARIPDDAVPYHVRGELSQGRRWIAEMALLGRILAVANSEPGAGGDLHNTRTRALVDGEGRTRLHGTKSFATLGPDADYFLCSARHADDSLDAFFVSRVAEGVELADDWDALGMRATASVGLRLHGAEAAHVFVYPRAITQVNARHWSTLLLSAVFVGLGEGALLNAREALGTGAGYAHASLAEATLSVDAAAGWLRALASEEPTPCSRSYLEACQRAKTFAARAALDAATRALVVSGGRAYAPQHPVARFLLDAAAGPLLRPPLPQAMDAVDAPLCAAADDGPRA